jgi:hypothetical protein
MFVIVLGKRSIVIMDEVHINQNRKERFIIQPSSNNSSESKIGEGDVTSMTDVIFGLVEEFSNVTMANEWDERSTASIVEHVFTHGGDK